MDLPLRVSLASCAGGEERDDKIDDGKGKEEGGSKAREEKGKKKDVKSLMYTRLEH